MDDGTADRIDGLDDIVAELDISDLQRAFIRLRCLEQITWLEGRARSSQNRYNRLKMIAIVGGVTVPTLIGVQLGNPRVQSGIQWLTLVLGLAVAIATASDGFFKFGDRWRLGAVSCSAVTMPRLLNREVPGAWNPSPLPSPWPILTDSI